jgi:epoxyqueuosine reductase
MITDLLDTIIAHGDRGAAVSLSRVADIKKDMLDLKNGEFHPYWLDRMANHMTGDADKYIPADICFNPQSLISVAMPSPKVIIQFNFRGKPINCVLPPHYINGDSNNERVLQYIADYLMPSGYSAVTARTFPHKMLAVHCGLALYGRNNICYNDEFGSYMQIMTYISDLPCDETAWTPLGRMEICDGCSACVTSCPTGAIDWERRLVNSDRCITVVNELAGEFPEWIDKNAHNSITGCIKCQDCCPANKQNEGNVKMGVAFTEAETTEILNHKGDIPYSSSVDAKIESTGISREYTDISVLPRNLAALLQKNEPARTG